MFIRCYHRLRPINIPLLLKKKQFVMYIYNMEMGEFYCLDFFFVVSLLIFNF